MDISSTSGEAGDVIISGIFIKNVVPNSPAGHCGQLRVRTERHSTWMIIVCCVNININIQTILQTGDRILEVDGVDVRTASHEKAVQIIRAAGNPVNFLIQSLLPWVSVCWYKVSLVMTKPSTMLATMQCVTIFKHKK